MKKTRILSVIISAIMSVSMISGVFSAVAVESESNAYTLEELLAMSDEEFLTLEKAEAYYEKLKKDTEMYDGISGTLYMNVSDEGTGYEADVTEEKITELLGDTVNYEISSPLSSDIYSTMMFLYFPDYNKAETDDDIMEFSKCWYCVDQVVKMYHMPLGIGLGGKPGDVEDTETKIYTLEELFAMSDEEFLAIPEEAYGMTTENCFSQVEAVSETCGYTAAFAAELIDKKVEFEYIPNVTENEISELIGDTIECGMSGIAIVAYQPYYTDTFSFYVYGFDKLMADKSSKDINMMLAKVMYCVRQIIPVTNMEAALPKGDDYKEPVVTGDVNFDKTVDLYDVIWLAKGLTNQFKLTDAQLVIADVNNDGIVNVFDRIMLSRKMLDNYGI